MPKETSVSETSHALTVEDIPRVFASLAVFGAAFGFGAGLSVLGPALPELSEQLGVDVAVCGQVFSWRGIGVLLGTFGVASMLERDTGSLTKHMIVVIIILFSGLVTYLISVIAPLGNTLAFNLVKGLILLEGITFGAMDTLVIVAMQEMWGQRVGPWMQMRNLMSSAGAIVGPVSVSKYGFNIAFQVCALTCLSCLIGTGLETFYSFLDKRRSKQSLIANELETLAVNLHAIQAEMTNQGGSVLRSIGSIDLGSTVSGEDQMSDGRDRVLSYATPEIVEMLEDSPLSKILDIHIIPIHVSYVIGFFAFLHIGLIYVYGGWISTYTIMIDPTATFSDAAQMASLYAASCCISSIYAIPLSIYLNTSTLLRFQLSILLIAALTLFFPMDNITRNSTSAVIMGLAVSCIYPLLMTVANDYKMTMDSKGIFYLVMGGGLGESVAPAAAGILIANYGPSAFPVTVTATALFMIASYFYVHIALTYYQNKLVASDVLQETQSLLGAGEEETRSRASTRTMSRGWRSLSVEKYSGPVGLEMIVNGVPGGDTAETGTSHYHYQQQS